MAEIPSPSEIVTMSSLRTDPKRLGVPFDAPAFVVRANTIVGQREDDSVIHTHLIGDASVIAEKSALAREERSDGGFRATVEDLRELLLGAVMPDNEGRDNSPPGPASEEIKALRPHTDARIKLYTSMADVLGLNVDVCSAMNFLRRKKSLAHTALRVMLGVFDERVRNMPHDLTAMDFEARGELIPADYVSSGMTTLHTLLRSTLPTRLRQIPPDEQLRHAAYAAMEGSIAAAAIEEGDIYASYRGSEMAGDKPIIQHMKELTMLAVFYAISPGLMLKVSEGFLVDGRLDGKGVKFDNKSQRAIPVAVDPHTMDIENGGASEGASSNGSTPPLKLPLLPYDQSTGGLRAVREAEFQEAITAEDTGGIVGAKQQLFLHSLPVFGAYLTEERIRSEVIQQLLAAHGVQEAGLRDWVIKVRHRLTALQEGREAHRMISPIVPGGKIGLISGIAHQLALDILAGMEQSERDGAAA